MKKIAMILGILMVILGLNSCIVANSPSTKELIKVPVGDNVQFKVRTLGGVTVWKLNDNKVDLGASYTFVAKEAGTYTVKAINQVRLTWEIEVYEEQNTPDPEICDGKDNDEDGKIDEDIVAVPTTCGVGACAATGQKTCVNGQLTDSCVPGNSTAETCDGVDNDCNGKTDDGLPSTPTTCGVGACAATGANACVNGVMKDTCTPGKAGVEVCDGIDNDCDGQKDEEIAPAASTCGVGDCASTGTQSCVDGKIVDTCVAGQSKELPVCLPESYSATADANCNGQPDKQEKGVCAELCNGLDDDGDTLIDEGIAKEAISCGVGACKATGERACSDGKWVDSCTAGTPGVEVCDAIDNDCDGQNNEGLSCDVQLCPKVSGVQASDKTSNDVVINWDVCDGATKYKVFRAIWEEDAEYEEVAEVTTNTYTYVQDWQTDVVGVVGPVPRMRPDATMAEKADFQALLDDFREDIMPLMMNHKCPSFFKVQACSDTECSEMSDLDAGQAKLIHTAAFSEIAEMTINAWGYGALSVLSKVPEKASALTWCGMDLCGAGGGMVLARLNPANLQTDVWFDNYREAWDLHPNSTAAFMANGYLGARITADDGSIGILNLAGKFDVTLYGDTFPIFVWFYSGGWSGYPNAGKMTFNMPDGTAYKFDLPVQPFDWTAKPECSHTAANTPPTELTKIPKACVSIPGWHHPYPIEYPTVANGLDDDRDCPCQWDYDYEECATDEAGKIIQDLTKNCVDGADADGEQFTCPDGTFPPVVTCEY